MGSESIDDLNISYFENGAIHYCCEMDEKYRFHGMYVFFYNSGAVSEIATYEHGEPTGVHRSWYEDGQLSSEIHFQNYNVHGSLKRWHRNGEVCEEAEYINGEVNGIYTRRYMNGVVKQTSEIVNGVETLRLYSPDGSLVYIEQYNSNNERHGISLHYNKKGKCIGSQFWYHDLNITDQVTPIVKDIASITEQEKIHLILALGVTI
jgi:antitoxin component YwqK of YwqJK toxin-antitoxin module